MPRYIKLRETASTNTYMHPLAGALKHATVIYTYRQTSGRGQTGNNWESEDGMNLTFSMLLKPTSLEASRQFALSEAVSLAIIDVVEPLVPPGLSVKWPNDIYHDNKKLAGLLIENSLRGKLVEWSIAGVGLNVNQERFLSPAPNPVSIKQLSGQDNDTDELLHLVCESIDRRFGMIADSEGIHQLHADYLSHLYRNDGHPHVFSLPDGERFAATIKTVQPDGQLVLTLDDGSTHTFAFKQVQHCINDYLL